MKLVLFLASAYFKLWAVIQVVIFLPPNILNWILRSLGFTPPTPTPRPQTYFESLFLADIIAHLLSFLCPFRTGTPCTFLKEDSAGLMRSYCLQAADNFCKVCLQKKISTSKAVYQLLSSTGKKDTFFVVLETVRRTNQSTEYLPMNDILIMQKV